MPLQRKLLLVILPLVVLPLLAVAWLTYDDLRDQRMRAIDQELADLLGAAQRRYETLRSSILANTRLFASNALIQRYARIADPADRYDLVQPVLIRQFRRYQEVYPDYYELRFVDPDGFEDTRVVNLPLRNHSEQFAIRPPEGHGGRPVAVWHRLERNPDNGEWALLGIAPVTLPAPGSEPAERRIVTAGYVVVTVSLRSVFDGLRQLAADSGATLELIDARGHLLSADGSAAATLHPVVGAALNRAQPPGLPARWEAQRPGDPLARLRPLDDGLYALASVSTHATLVDIEALFQQALAVTLLGVLLVAGITIVFLRRVVLHPVERLCDATRRIGLGEACPPLPVAGRDELAELARSVTEMKANLDRSQARIVTLAEQDQLTGLPNRRAFLERLEAAVEQARRGSNDFALMFLDIDNFKAVNDSLGHPVGDRLLRQVAARLGSVIRHGGDGDLSTLSRIGGDEFLVLLWGIGEAAVAAAIAERLFEVFREPVDLGEQRYFARASIGIALYPGSGEDAETLIRHADIAMYAAKARGKNRYHFFDDSLNVEVQRRMAVIGRLETALENDEFHLVFQPKLALSDGRIRGAEVLIRWHNPVLGAVGPAEFIPIAEQTGLIHAIGEWVLESSMRQLRAWTDTPLAECRLAVNLSAVQLGSAGLPAHIGRLVAQHGIDPGRIELELTETALVDDPDRAGEALQALKALGFTLSLDDFGTGYASLSQLNRLPIDEIKIDRSFVADMERRADARKIIVGVVAMAHSMGLRVIAEGVETEEQEHQLRRIGCDEVQGFFYARPMPLAEFERFVASRPG